MKTKQKPRVRVNKSKKLARRRFPRWAMFVVIGLVAVVGIALIITTFAAGVLPTNTAKVINGGSVSTDNSVSSMARSPITLEACRMSDTPGEGEANRVYVGAKPVISSYVANKLNSVWDRYYPEYHINGQNVTYAADYQMPEQVFYDASYIVDKDKPTDTQEQYKDFILPSEGYPQYFSGKFWVPFGVPGQPDWFESKYFSSPGKAVKKFWDNATIYTRNASYFERNYSGEGSKNSPFPGGTGSTSSNKSTNRTVATTSATNQSNPSDVSKLNAILGTVTSTTNPNLGLYPGTLPGRTSWNYLEGPVARYNDAKCPGGKAGGFSCANNPNAYDTINNPNPFIKFDVSWMGGRTVGSVNENSKKLVDHDVKIMRFKDLPKCGNNPLQTQNQIDSKADFSKVIYGNYERAFNQIKAEGINVGVAGKGQDRMSEIFLNNGISPLASLGAPYWTGLPPKGTGAGLPGYGNYGTAAYPEPY